MNIKKKKLILNTFETYTDCITTIILVAIHE